MKWHLQALRYVGHIGNIDTDREYYLIVLGIVLSRAGSNTGQPDYSQQADSAGRLIRRHTDVERR